MTREELYARRAFMAEKGITKCGPGVAYGAVDSKLTVRPKSFNQSKSAKKRLREKSLKVFGGA